MKQQPGYSFSKRKKIYKYLAWGLVLLILGILIKPLSHLLKSSSQKYDYGFIVKDGYADDVSRLNLSPIDSSIDVVMDSSGMVRQLKELVLYAKAHKLKIAIAGAMHSMGDIPSLLKALGSTCFLSKQWNLILFLLFLP